MRVSNWCLSLQGGRHKTCRLLRSCSAAHGVNTGREASAIHVLPSMQPIGLWCMPNTAAMSCCCPHRTSALFHCQLRRFKVYTSPKTSSLSMPPINHTKLPTNVAECIARGGMPGGKLATGLPILHVALSNSNTSLYMADLQDGLRKVLRCALLPPQLRQQLQKGTRQATQMDRYRQCKREEQLQRAMPKQRHIPSAPCSYQNLPSG